MITMTKDEFNAIARQIGLEIDDDNVVHGFNSYDLLVPNGWDVADLKACHLDVVIVKESIDKGCPNCGH